MNNSTLTQKLFVRITLTILVTIAAIGAFAFNSATREINNVYDAQLISNANVLWMLLQDEFREAGATGDLPKQAQDIDFDAGDQMGFSEDADDYADARMFRGWRAHKLVLFSSTAFPAAIPEQQGGFSKVVYKNEVWRVYALAIPHTQIVIEVGEKIGLRDTLVYKILLNLFFSLLVLVPIIGALVWFGISSGLGVIHLMVQQIRSRSPEDLSAIPTNDLPRDLFPLGKSINQLLSKLEHSLTAERRFSDHAAHQLRTPQAGIKLLLQMLAKTDNEEERKAIIADLLVSTDKATKLIEQLLRAARVSHQPIELTSVALYGVAAMVMADMEPLVQQKNLHVSLGGEQQAHVLADESLLKLMVGNLLDNAIKYTPADGRIQLDIRSIDGMWLLSISDNGPGIPENQRESVFQRFYRVDTPDTEGTGLGLAIVADIVERFSGTIALKNPASGPGLMVEVFIPKA